MSLWTPGGEHEVPREQATPNPTPTGPPPSGPAAEPTGLEDMPGYEDLSPEEQAQVREMAAEMAETRARIAQTPAAEVVANHVMGLYELAAIHLGSQPPAMGEAQTAIDAMAAVMAALPGRLGENESVLTDALAQLQLAFVQVTNALQEAGMGEEPNDGEPEGA